jgi:RNA polymerase sigma-70 factor (ECF subfamily)
MSAVDGDESLSQIETRWSLVRQAHQAEGPDCRSAQHALMESYIGAIHRYLLRVARNEELASELSQEFALRFLRGDFHRADPRRGRFRDYLKVAVLNLLTDARRRQKASPRSLPKSGVHLPDPSEDPTELDRWFLESWRDELLSRAWARLASQQERTGQPFYTVLRHRADFPKQRSHEIAEQLQQQLGKPISAEWVRQTLRRARTAFVEYLKAEVDRSLDQPSQEQRIAEMQALGLWEYCREKPRDKSD